VDRHVLDGATDRIGVRRAVVARVDIYRPRWWVRGDRVREWAARCWTERAGHGVAHGAVEADRRGGVDRVADAARRAAGRDPDGETRPGDIGNVGGDVIGDGRVRGGAWPRVADNDLIRDRLPRNDAALTVGFGGYKIDRGLDRVGVGGVVVAGV